MLLVTNGPDPVVGALVSSQHAALVSCEPLGAVTLGRRVDVFLQALDSASRGIPLGSRRSVDEVRLPAGRYRLLVVDGVRAMEQHVVQVRSGHTTAVTTVAEPRSLAIPDGPQVYVQSWPGVPMPRAVGRVLVPGGRGPLRILVRTPFESGAVLERMWLDSEPAVFRIREFPRQAVVVRDSTGEPLLGARVVSVRSPAGGPRIVAAAQTDGRGRVEIPVAEHADPRSLVVTARGFSPVTVPWSGESTEIELSRGQRVRLQVLDPRGDPAVGIPVQLIRPNAPLLTSNHTTDRLGSLSLDGLPVGGLKVRLTHPTVLDRAYSVEIPAGPPQTVRIQTDPGFRVVGRILLPDGKPAPGALVSVRDTTGRSGLPEKIAVSDADGEFEIGGLPENSRLRLGAKLTLEERSYISQQVWVRPGGSRWEIELKQEDPDLAGRRKKKAARRPGR